MKKNKIEKGADGFESHYSGLFGERWSKLKEELEKKASPVELQGSLLQPYFMDEASIAVAESLQVEAGERVLDLCSAPGGKALVLALKLKGRGALVCNDISTARRLRLLKVLREHLPMEFMDVVSVKGVNGVRLQYLGLDPFDKILIDAPCSSERHVMHVPNAMKMWSPARIKRQSKIQVSLLTSTLPLLKPGGSLVYSTCALNPSENDGVVEKFIQKKGDELTKAPLSFEWGEVTKWGWEIFPDKCDGRGPMYLSKWIKP